MHTFDRGNCMWYQDTFPSLYSKTIYSKTILLLIYIYSYAGHAKLLSSFNQHVYSTMVYE